MLFTALVVQKRTPVHTLRYRFGSYRYHSVRIKITVAYDHLKSVKCGSCVAVGKCGYRMKIPVIYLYRRIAEAFFGLQRMRQKLIQVILRKRL